MSQPYDLPHLKVEEEETGHVVLRQKEFADGWKFSASFDGCVNFGQVDSATTNEDGEGGEPRSWEHLCDLRLMIEMLLEVEAEAVKRWPDAYGKDAPK